MRREWPPPYTGNGPPHYKPGSGAAVQRHALSARAYARGMHTQRAVQATRVASGPPLYSKQELRRNYVYRGTGEDTLTPEGTFLPGWSDTATQGKREYAYAQRRNGGKPKRHPLARERKLKVNALPRCPQCGMVVTASHECAGGQDWRREWTQRKWAS